jgi:uncharacterized protein YvpB
MKRLRVLHKTSSVWNLIILTVALILAVLLNLIYADNSPLPHKIILNPMLNAKILNPKAEATKIHSFNQAQLAVNYYNPSILNLPLLAQQHKNSGDAANIRSILSFYGQYISEDKILLSFTPYSNPHKGFRGQVDKDPSLDNYGVYAEPVVKVFQKYGVSAETHYFLTEDELKAQILSGKPAIIWTSTDKADTAKPIVKSYQGRYELVAGKKTLLVAGYTGGLWHLYDPGGLKDSKSLYHPKVIKTESLDRLGWDRFDHMTVVAEGNNF